jgi:hypothetical protein
MTFNKQTPYKAYSLVGARKGWETKMLVLGLMKYQKKSSCNCERNVSDDSAKRKDKREQEEEKIN